MNGTAPAEIWQRHPGLVWSNAGADDGVRLRAALLRPRFDTLLDLALHFGTARLRAEWAWLAGEDSPEVRRARPCVDRILRNIEEGFARAHTEHAKSVHRGRPNKILTTQFDVKQRH